MYGIILEQQTSCDLRYKEDNQPQYESRMVFIDISKTKLNAPPFKFLNINIDSLP